MASGLFSRMDDAALESFEPRGPIPGLSTTPLQSFRNSVQDLVITDKDDILQYAEHYFPEKKVYDGSPPMNAEEGRAIYLYTCDSAPPKFYQVFNDHLRDKDRSKLRQYLPILKLLLSAMSKLQSRPGRVLWRGVKKDLYDMYKDKVGKTVVFWGFTSSTTDMQVLDSFLPPQGGTIFCVAWTLEPN